MDWRIDCRKSGISSFISDCIYSVTHIKIIFYLCGLPIKKYLIFLDCFSKITDFSADL